MSKQIHLTVYTHSHANRKKIHANNYFYMQNGVCTRDQLSRDQLLRDQFLPDQLCMKSTLSRSTLIESTFQMINSTTEIN